MTDVTEDWWIDATKLGSDWEVQVNPQTGRARHRPLRYVHGPNGRGGMMSRADIDDWRLGLPEDERDG